MANSEIKNCKNCKAEFVVEPEDFAFYEKMDVPPPTWCPRCRSIRRMAFSNERSLYKRDCDLCKKSTISIYEDDVPFPVYCLDCWHSDLWDAKEYAQEYDFNRPFFEQFLELKNKVPHVALIHQWNINSPYLNRASKNKDCYLLFRANFNENVLYGQTINETKDSLDGLAVQHSELCYESIDCTRCYNVQYSQEAQDCRDSMFLFDCRNCTNCFGCVNLRNAKYHIFNEPYSKEEYEKKIASFGIDNYASLQMMKEKFGDFSKKFFKEFMVSTRAERSSGNWIYNTKNTHHSFYCRDTEDCKYMYGVFEAKDVMDSFCWGRGIELVYDTANVGYSASRIRFCNLVYNGCSDLDYCESCISSTTNCFGCVGLKNGEYCILNKVYSEEEYKTLREKIIQHMNEMPYTDSRGRVYPFGEYFPLDVSEYAYNETAAQDYFPLDKKHAIEQGYKWKDRKDRAPHITIPAKELPMTISDIEESVLNEVIGCEHKGECSENCTVAFKIVPYEFQFYKRLNIPLPRLCHNCRHGQRLKKRNPPQLWQRQCDCDYEVYKNSMKHLHHETGRCPNEFETSYAPDRDEVVYCGACYNGEVV